MAILTVGIDPAKNVFAVHGVNEAGRAELVCPTVAREKLHELIAALPPCLIGMEACSGAHHWARLFCASGHTVRLIAPSSSRPPVCVLHQGPQPVNGCIDDRVVVWPVRTLLTSVALQRSAVSHQQETNTPLRGRRRYWLDEWASPCSSS